MSNRIETLRAAAVARAQAISPMADLGARTWGGFYAYANSLFVLIDEDKGGGARPVDWRDGLYKVAKRLYQEARYRLRLDLRPEVITPATFGPRVMSMVYHDRYAKVL